MRIERSIPKTTHSDNDVPLEALLQHLSLVGTRIDDLRGRRFRFRFVSFIVGLSQDLASGNDRYCFGDFDCGRFRLADKRGIRPGRARTPSSRRLWPINIHHVIIIRKFRIKPLVSALRPARSRSGDPRWLSSHRQLNDRVGRFKWRASDDYLALIS